jgi:hypothetical protein
MTTPSPRPYPRVRGFYELKDDGFAPLETVLLWTTEERCRFLTANARRSLEASIRKLDTAGAIDWRLPAPSQRTAH